MNYVMHFFLGFIMAFLSLIPPGMLNMTAVKHTIDKSSKEGIMFSLGAALVVIPQAFIALVFARFFANNPQVIEQLNWAGVIVLFTLSVVFWLQARRKFKGKGSVRKGKSFLMGVMMSTMNMLAIPFYLVLSSFLENRGQLIMEQPYINMFIGGVFFGALSLFLTYVRFALVIQKKASFIARNINYILSALFFILGILSVIKMFK